MRGWFKRLFDKVLPPSARPTPPSALRYRPSKSALAQGAFGTLAQTLMSSLSSCIIEETSIHHGRLNVVFNKAARQARKQINRLYSTLARGAFNPFECVTRKGWLLGVHMYGASWAVDHSFVIFNHTHSFTINVVSFLIITLFGQKVDGGLIRMQTGRPATPHMSRWHGWQTRRKTAGIVYRKPPRSHPHLDWWSWSSSSIFNHYSHFPIDHRSDRYLTLHQRRNISFVSIMVFIFYNESLSAFLVLKIAFLSWFYLPSYYDEDGTRPRRLWYVHAKKK